jgi:hypothetical protein
MRPKPRTLLAAVSVVAVTIGACTGATAEPPTPRGGTTIEVCGGGCAFSERAPALRVAEIWRYWTETTRAPC